VSENTHRRVSLKQYYSSARGLATAAAALALPFASKVTGPDIGSSVFPPLGNMDAVARIALVAMCLALSLAVYFLAAVRPPKSPLIGIGVAFALTLVCALGYLSAYQRFVRRIDVPSRQTSVYVSVGYHRTAFAERTFGPASDEDMLRARGTTDEEIARLWTSQSLIIARLALFLTCAMATLAVLFIFSFGLVHDINR